MWTKKLIVQYTPVKIHTECGMGNNVHIIKYLHNAVTTTDTVVPLLQTNQNYIG